MAENHMHEQALEEIDDLRERIQFLESERDGLVRVLCPDKSGPVDSDLLLARAKDAIDIADEKLKAELLAAAEALEGARKVQKLWELLTDGPEPWQQQMPSVLFDALDHMDTVADLPTGTAMLEVARAAEKVARYWQNPVSSTVLDDALDGLVKACAGLKHTT